MTPDPAFSVCVHIRKAESTIGMRDFSIRRFALGQVFQKWRYRSPTCTYKGGENTADIVTGYCHSWRIFVSDQNVEFKLLTKHAYFFFVLACLHYIHIGYAAWYTTHSYITRNFVVPPSLLFCLFDGSWRSQNTAVREAVVFLFLPTP